jgi:hypothetical protein
MSDDDVMLAAYDEVMARAARLIEAMGGDPGKPTPDQARAAAAMIIAEAAASGYRPNVKQMLKDHRRITRLRDRRSV